MHWAPRHLPAACPHDQPGPLSLLGAAAPFDGLSPQLSPLLWPDRRSCSPVLLAPVCSFLLLQGSRSGQPTAAQAGCPTVKATAARRGRLLSHSRAMAAVRAKPGYGGAVEVEARGGGASTSGSSAGGGAPLGTTRNRTDLFLKYRRQARGSTRPLTPPGAIAPGVER